jgi:hypothetical protein
MPPANIIWQGLLMYALALPFVFFFWLNQKTGTASIALGLPLVHRARSPVRFWVAQAWLGFVVFCCFVAGTLIIMGITPP